jgi:dienelactone hydrolase
MAAAENLFAPYLTRKPPEDVRVLTTEHRGGVEIRHILFYSWTTQTETGPVRSEISAVVMRPDVQGRHPGLLLLHGGGGSAQEDMALDWAKRGFVVLAPDLPGIGNSEKIKNGSGAWKQLKYGVNHFRVDEDATSSDIFDGVLAALQSLYLLRSFPDVNPHRIGVTGVSWGGYATIMVAGLAGKDIRAAYSIYGAGNYDLGSAFQKDLAKLSKEKADIWLQQLDARNYAPGIRAHFFEAAATNDTFFWIPAVSATLEEIHSPKNFVYAPNSNHWMDIPGGCERTEEGVPHDNGWMSMQTVYFEYALMGKGKPFPRVMDDGATPAGEHAESVRFRVKGAVGATRATVYYSQTGSAWATRKWLPVKADRRGGWYRVEIPAGSDWLALVTDARPVTVSSGVHSGSGTLESATQ